MRKEDGKWGEMKLTAASVLVWTWVQPVFKNMSPDKNGFKNKNVLKESLRNCHSHKEPKET